MPRMLDLCSGLGGASEGFLANGWDVVRIENNPLLADVPHTQLLDIFEWDYEAEEPFDLIWASPPCREFSTAYAAPRSVAQREGREYQPDMSILLKVIEIIDYFRPKHHVIENVSGASKFFTPIIGSPPRQIVGPFFLWGYFPHIIMDFDWTHSKADGDTWSSDPLRANRRGKIPFEVSVQLFRSITGQKSLMEWY